MNKEKQVVTIADDGKIVITDIGNTDAVIKAPRAAALKAELEREKAKLEAIVAPARAFYEQHVNDPRYLEARKTIKEVNSKLGPICNELAALARAKGSKGIKIDSGHYDSKVG